MKLIVGLGNPGKSYQNTRHNVGFIILDDYLGDVKWSNKFNGLYFETNIKGEKYIFLKPQNYMNLSGGVVSQYMNFFKISPNDVLVIHDDLDLEFAKYRIKINSSAGGHNGIKDIIKAIGTKDFGRLKIGISNNKDIDTKDYVLGKFTTKQIQEILNNRDVYKDIIENYNYDNISNLMSKYN